MNYIINIFFIFDDLFWKTVFIRRPFNNRLLFSDKNSSEVHNFYQGQFLKAYEPLMMIAPNSHARKSEVKGQYGWIWDEKEGNIDSGGTCEPSKDIYTLKHFIIIFQKIRNIH